MQYEWKWYGIWYHLTLFYQFMQLQLYGAKNEEIHRNMQTARRTIRYAVKDGNRARE